ncbi:MAG TPA: type II 3-dehydroquinate dehydratase [Acidimicrobiales bacterium]|nr:type II 3-dehydroquinate dehydratase [Acidimicrobiales bacterium]
MKTVLLLSGPNLSRTGQRQPDIYGTETLGDIVKRARKVAAEAGWQLEHLAAESEGPLIEAVHAARGAKDAIVINPGALTHYAWGLADALSTFDGPVVEVHLSQPAGREPWRRVSVVAPVATASISGLGAAGYEAAVLAVARMS